MQYIFVGARYTDVSERSHRRAYAGGTEKIMRINDLINNNIQTGTGNGINNDLSLSDGAGSYKDKATALLKGNDGAVGFFVTKGTTETRETGKTVNYTINDAKGLGGDPTGFGTKIINEAVNGPKSNDRELVKNLTGDDYESLNDEGMSLEKFSKERLERAIERIKDDRKEREVRLAEGVEKQQEYRDAIDRMAAYVSLDSGTDKLIAKLLYEADIPVTEERIEEVKQAADRVNGELKLSDSSENYLIKNRLSPTIDNIYKASHSGEMRQVKIDDAAWESLKDKASEIVNEAGIDHDKGMENARWLLDHDLPITAENIRYKSELDELGTSEDLSKEDIYKAAVNSIADGRKADEGLLIIRSDTPESIAEKQIEEAVQNIELVNDDTIKAALENTGADEISVQNLVDTAVQAQEKETGSTNAASIVSQELTEKEVITKIRFEEAKLSLNIEAGRRLMAKGINIVSDSLMRVTEGIREIQKEYLKNLFDEIGADSKDTALKTISADEASELALKTADSLEKISGAPLELYKATFSVRQTITLAEISETGETLITTSEKSASGTISVTPASMKSALTSYEESSTEVRRDLGDSIKKAFSGSVDSILESTGLELTEGNRRAVRILGYNSMEITAESIVNMKYYDEKVTGLIDRMTPPVVMTMIREGINPLESTIDELSEKVSSILSEQGASVEQKYSEFLIRMEAADSITENERNAYIGIYRLLYNVEKNDGAAIGRVLSSGRELTFRNLMTESRSFDLDVDLTADDTSGIKNSRYVNSVTAQIDEAFIYQRSLVQDALTVTEPDIWDNALSGKDYLSTTIEELHDGLENAAANSTGTSAQKLADQNTRAQDIVRTMMANTSVSSFLNSFGIKNSYENRKAAEDVFSNTSSEDASINVTSDEVNEALDSGSRFDELLGIKTRMANSLTGQAFRTAITAQAAAELNSRVERIEMLEKLAGKGHYRMNIDDGEESKTVNLTLIRNSENAGTVSVEIQKEDYNIQADMSMVIMDSEYSAPYINRATVHYSGNVPENIEQKAEDLKNELKNNGINADNISVTSGTRSEETYISYLAQMRSRADNGTGLENADSMYMAAKSFLAIF